MANPPDPGVQSGLSRRAFLKGAGGVAAGGVLSKPADAEPQPFDPRTAPALSGPVEIQLDINGKAMQVEVEPRTTLLHALRHHCSPALTGAKEVCDRGNCGACTVMIDGRPVYSCLHLAVQQQGRKIRTVEGLGTPEEMSPVQEAFCEKDALMCGFCTPGFVMSITACLEKNPAADREEVRDACAGNICRCGTYPHVFDAALAAGKKMQGGR